MNAPHLRSSSDRPTPMSMTGTSMNEPTRYFVFSADHNHVGPVTAELIGRGVVAGKVPTDAFVAPLGSNLWIPLGSVPELNLAVAVARGAHSSLRPTPQPGSIDVTGPPPPLVPRDLAMFLPPPAPLPNAVAHEPAPAAASVAPTAEEKPEPKSEKEEKKPVLDPRFKLLPLAIFGVFALLGGLETAFALHGTAPASGRTNSLVFRRS